MNSNSIETEVLGATPAAPSGGGGLPENVKKDNLKILVENASLTDEESFIDLSGAKNSLGEIETELNKLLRD